jgi:hypothetical protein
MVQGNQTDLGGSRGRFRTMLSRRGVMAAAVASAAVALTRASNPPTALAVANFQTETNNATAATTTLAKSGGPAGPALTVTNTNADGIDAIAGAGYGVNALGPSAGVFGATTAVGSFGVWGQMFGPGTSGAGVFGNGTTPSTVGVWGNSTASVGVQGSSTVLHGVYGSASAASSSGVFGNCTSASGSGVSGSSGPGIGVFATSTSSVGLFAISSSSTAVVGRTTTGKAAEFFGNVEITGDFTASGMKSAAVRVADGSVRRMYCLESPVSYFEDMGTGQVTNGSGSVTLDPMFVSTVSTDDYFVYLTPDGDCRGLYVESKSAGGFSVKELMGGTSTVTFSWRVVAKRTGITNERFAPVSMSLDKNGGPKLSPQHIPDVPEAPSPNSRLTPR